MKKYSSIQRWEILPTNKYRVKNFINKKWEYINVEQGKWIFKGITFSNATLLRQHLNIENKMYNSEIN